MRVCRPVCANDELRELRDKGLRKDPLAMFPDVCAPVGGVGHEAGVCDETCGGGRCLWPLESAARACCEEPLHSETFVEGWRGGFF